MTAFVLLRIEDDAEALRFLEDAAEYPGEPLLTPCQENTVYATIVSPRPGKHSGAKPLNFPTEVRPDLRNMLGLGARIAESVRWSA